MEISREKHDHRNKHLRSISEFLIKFWIEIETENPQQAFVDSTKLTRVDPISDFPSRSHFNLHSLLFHYAKGNFTQLLAENFALFCRTKIFFLLKVKRFYWERGSDLTSVMGEVNNSRVDHNGLVNRPEL